MKWGFIHCEARPARRARRSVTRRNDHACCESGAGCACEDSSRHRAPLTTLRRRPSDFDGPAAAQPYSGACCCCCCCLHWIGAIVGGAVGMPMGWSGARRKSFRPMHPKARSALFTGLFVGLGVTFVSIILLGIVASLSGGLGDIASPFLIALVFVPSLFFLPVGGCMLFFTWMLKRTNPVEDAEAIAFEGIYCPNCLYDLRGSLNAVSCPECGAYIDHQRLERGVDYGIGTAWRASWMCFVWSTVLSVVGYAIMFGLAAALN